MAKAKLQAPEPLTEKLGATLPSVIAEEAQFNANRTEIIAKVDAAFSFEEPWDKDAWLNATQSKVADAALSDTVAGAYLLRAKAYLGHGEFLEFVVDRCKLHPRRAQRWMKMAGRLIGPDGKQRPVLVAISGTRGQMAKAMELLSLSDDELDALDAGEEVGGVTLENIAAMTPSDLREELGARDIEITKVREQNQKLIEETEAADKEIRRLKRGGKEVEQSNFAEILDDCTTAFDEQFKVAEKMIVNLADTMNLLDETIVPAHMEDIAKRTLVMGSHARMVQLGEIVARLIDRHEITFSRFHSDSKHRLPDAEGAML